MTRWPKITQALGLHEDLYVIYCVDCYAAGLRDEEDEKSIAEAEGKSIEDALDELEKKLI